MVEFNYTKELNTNVDYDYITDAMTGDRDARMHLYHQLFHSFEKADSVDIIVSFLMESGVKMLIEDLENTHFNRELSWHYTAICTLSD